MPSFTCPKCKKSLKTAAAIPAGKKIKCPACTHVFVMPDLGETTIQVNRPLAVSRTAALSSIAKERDRERPTEMDRPKRRRPDMDGEDEAPRKSSRKAKSRRGDDDPDRDEDEDRRARRRRKKKQAQSNTGLILILSGAGALVLLLILVGGFVWPGFFKGSKARAAGPVDPFAFVPNNCEMVFGASLAQYRNKPGFQREFEKGLKQSGQLSPLHIDYIKNLDRVVIALSDMGPNPTGVGVFTSATALDPQKVRQVFSAGPPQEVQGKTIYKINDPSLPKRLLMSLPDDKTVVFGLMSEANFVKLLDGKSKLPPIMQGKANALSGKLFWTIVDLQAVMKDKAQAFDGLQMMPGGAQVATAVKNAKLVSFFYDYASDIRMELNIQCANEPDAEQVETFAKNFWEQQGKAGLAMAPLMFGNQPGGDVVGKMFEEIGKSFQIERQGTQVSASITISENLVKELEQMQGMNFNPMFNPGAGPGVPNPGVPNPGVANPGEANPGAVQPAPAPKRPNRPPPKRPPKSN